MSIANLGQQTIEANVGDPPVLYAQHGARIEVLCKAVGMQSLIEVVRFRKVGDVDVNGYPFPNPLKRQERLI